MADWVWKGVYLQVLGRSRELLLNKFFDPSLPSMRKVDNGKKEKETPTDWNAARSCQKTSVKTWKDLVELCPAQGRTTQKGWSPPIEVSHHPQREITYLKPSIENVNFCFHSTSVFVKFLA